MTIITIDKEQQEFTAPVKGNEVAWIIAYESDELGAIDCVRLIAWLARSGMLGGLQGHYHRIFEHLCNTGVLLNKAGIVDFECLDELINS